MDFNCFLVVFRRLRSLWSTTSWCGTINVRTNRRYTQIDGEIFAGTDNLYISTRWVQLLYYRSKYSVKFIFNYSKSHFKNATFKGLAKEKCKIWYQLYWCYQITIYNWARQFPIKRTQIHCKFDVCKKFVLLQIEKMGLAFKLFPNGGAHFRFPITDQAQLCILYSYFLQDQAGIEFVHIYTDLIRWLSAKS